MRHVGMTAPSTAARGRGIRILGLTLEPIVDFRAGFSRNSGLYAALDRRFNVTGIVRPVLPRWEDRADKLLHVRPDWRDWRLSRWSASAALNPRRFRRQTAIAENQLRRWEGEYDLILELQTLCAPGLRFRHRRYAIYTDNIYPLTERYYPAWAPLRRREGARWMELEEMTCQSARVVFATSRFLRQALIDSYGCDPQRVVEVGAGSNSLLHSLEEKSYGTQTALFVGDKFEIKGGPTLLHAWDIVRRQLPGATLWVAGPTRSVGAEGRGVRWLGYVADRQALADLYTGAAVFVLPSLFDAFPHVIREAMGHGLPCIGSDQGGIPEMIEHGATGLIVPPSEPEPLAEALISLLSDPQRAESMGREAHMRTLEHHTWDHVAARMAPFIEQAVAPYQVVTTSSG
jgi:alpha-maltose-1-phosphate synthase